MSEVQLGPQDRLPPTVDSDCLGVECPNFKGVACGSRLEWICADAINNPPCESDKTPYPDEAKYIIYGQICGVNGLVTLIVVVYKPEMVDADYILDLAGSFGELPITIHTKGSDDTGIMAQTEL